MTTVNNNEADELSSIETKTNPHAERLLDDALGEVEAAIDEYRNAENTLGLGITDTENETAAAIHQHCWDLLDTLDECGFSRDLGDRTRRRVTLAAYLVNAESWRIEREARTEVRA